MKKLIFTAAMLLLISCSASALADGDTDFVGPTNGIDNNTLCRGFNGNNSTPIWFCRITTNGGGGMQLFDSVTIGPDGGSTVNIYSKLVGAIQSTEKGSNGGVATLGMDGKVPTAQLPSVSIPVTSVFGRTGAVNAVANDYAASQVSNDSSVSGSTSKDALNNLKTGVDGKEPTIAAGTTGQFWRGDKTWQAITESNVTNLTTDLANRPTVRSGASQLSNAVLFTGTGTTTSGIVTFYLTNDGTSTGTALCPNGVDYRKGEVSDAANNNNYAYTLSNSNKTLDVNVKATGQVNLLSTLLITPPANVANGTTVNMFVVCH